MRNFLVLDRLPPKKNKEFMKNKMENVILVKKNLIFQRWMLITLTHGHPVEKLQKKIAKFYARVVIEGNQTNRVAALILKYKNNKMNVPKNYLKSLI